MAGNKKIVKKSKPKKPISEMEYGEEFKRIQEGFTSSLEESLNDPDKVSFDALEGLYSQMMYEYSDILLKIKKHHDNTD